MGKVPATVGVGRFRQRRLMPPRAPRGIPPRAVNLTTANCIPCRAVVNAAPRTARANGVLSAGAVEVKLVRANGFLAD